MRLFDDKVRGAVDRLADDAVVQRVVPARVDGDVEICCAKRLGNLLETAAVPLEDGVASLVRCAVTGARQLRAIVADEQLDSGGRMPREPDCALDRRMKAGGGVDDDEQAFRGHGAPLT